MPYCRKRKLFNNPNEPTEARTHYTQHLEGDLRMLKAKCLKVLFADEEQDGIIDCRYRCGITATIKNRELRDRTARSIDAEHLFAPVG